MGSDLRGPTVLDVATPPRPPLSPAALAPTDPVEERVRGHRVGRVNIRLADAVRLPGTEVPSPARRLAAVVAAHNNLEQRHVVDERDEGQGIQIAGMRYLPQPRGQVAHAAAQKDRERLQGDFLQ